MMMAHQRSLYDALRRLPFANSDEVKADMNFSMEQVTSIYLEPEAPIRALWSWADGTVTPIKPHTYLFQQNASIATSPLPDRSGSSIPGWAVPPSGMRSAPPLGGLAAGTIELRADGSIHASTIENNSPAGSAKVSSFEDAALGLFFHDGTRSGSKLLRTHPPANLPGVAAINFSGAVPFARLTPSDPSIPTGLGLTLYGRSRWLVGNMTRSAVPAAAFTLTASNPTDRPVELALYFTLPLQAQRGVIRSMGSWEPSCSDHNHDCTACVAAQEMRSYWAGPCVFLNSSLPQLGNQTCWPEVTWKGQQSKYPNVSVISQCPAPPSPRPLSALACHAACAANSSCASWNYAFSTCTQHGNFTQVPPARNTPIADAMSGVKGTWAAGVDPRCVTLSRPGTHAAAGNASLCAAAQVEDRIADNRWRVRAVNGANVTMSTGSTPAALWREFAASGELGARLKATDPYGALSIKLVLPPGGRASASISLGWLFPHRDFVLEDVGNHYANLVKDSEHAALELLSDDNEADISEWAEVANVLAGGVDGRSSLPQWFGDSLLNTLHHTRSAMWLRDGRWRQWESFSCVNVDSVHNDGERHIPYLMLWPEGTESKMRAWAAGQGKDGMIQEQLACGCATAVPPKLDSACGRTMGDVSSMFIVYLLELWQWGGNTKLLEELWPAAKRAAQWQMSRSDEFGLPHHVIDTYDGLNLDRYNVSAFSGFFHLVAMKAAAKLARAPSIADANFAAACDEALNVGRSAMDRLLWNHTASYYRSFTGGDAIMTDSMYAQVLANTLGLGTLTTDQQIQGHLRAVLRENDTPYGFLVQTGRYAVPDPEHNNQDNQIWMMGNANWATLAISHGWPLEKAFEAHGKTLKWWRSVIKDMWNVVAVSGGLGYNCEGQPLANSHYGYHIVAWHTLFALSGQVLENYDGAANLTFSPKVPLPFDLPVLVPGTVARLSGNSTGYHLEVLAGRALRLAAVAVQGCARRPTSLPQLMQPGDTISW